jgi:hypothetical protein
MNLGCLESTESSSEKSGRGRLSGDPAKKSVPFCLNKQLRILMPCDFSSKAQNHFTKLETQKCHAFKESPFILRTKLRDPQFIQNYDHLQ